MISFKDDDYALAAEALRDWTPFSREQAIEKFTKPVFDLLVLSRAVFFQEDQWRRLVSIRAIEEDREAVT